MTIDEHAAPPAGWDEFVGQSAGGTFCHLAGWKHVFEKAMGHRTFWLVAHQAGAWQGVLPLVRVKSRLFGDYLLSMPFLNDGGPLGSSEARAELSQAAVAMARRDRVDLLELRVRDEVPDLSTSSRKITVILDLAESAEKVFKGLDSKLRSQVRRPQKEGMTWREGPDELDGFYQVFSHTMRDLGTPVLPRSFFEAIRTALGPQVVFGSVYHQDRPVAAGCGFAFGEEFEITWAGSLREFSRQAPNMLLYWSLIERSVGKGLRRFNFGRCTPGSGTHRFKGQWGGRDVPLPWAQWSASGAVATPSPDRPLFRLATRAWSRLPLGVTNRVGPLLARGLP